MSEDQEQPEWGALIERKRNEMRPKLSARKAAERAGLSEGRWRQIVKGHQSAGGGNKIPVVGPPETVARMAQVVGVTASELAAAGRPDAAEALRAAEDSGRAHPERADAGGLDAQVMWSELTAWMEASDDEWPDDPPTAALMFWSTDQLFDTLRQRYDDLLASHKGRVQTIWNRNDEIEALKARIAELEDLSEPDDRVHLAVAAHEEETPIAGEQEESDTP